MNRLVVSGSTAQRGRLLCRYDSSVVSATPLWAEADLSYDDESVFWGFPKNDDRLIAMGTLE